MVENLLFYNMASFWKSKRVFYNHVREQFFRLACILSILIGWKEPCYITTTGNKCDYIAKSTRWGLRIFVRCLCLNVDCMAQNSNLVDSSV